MQTAQWHLCSLHLREDCGKFNRRTIGPVEERKKKGDGERHMVADAPLPYHKSRKESIGPIEFNEECRVHTNCISSLLKYCTK